MLEQRNQKHRDCHPSSGTDARPMLTEILHKGEEKDEPTKTNGKTKRQKKAVDNLARGSATRRNVLGPWKGIGKADNEIVGAWQQPKNTLQIQRSIRSRGTRAGGL